MLQWKVGVTYSTSKIGMFKFYQFLLEEVKLDQIKLEIRTIKVKNTIFDYGFLLMAILSLMTGISCQSGRFVWSKVII